MSWLIAAAAACLHSLLDFVYLHDNVPLVQGCWRALGSTFGKTITFKTTLKGNNLLMKNGLGDLWMPCVCFLGLLASLGFGLHKVRLYTLKHSTVDPQRLFVCNYLLLLPSAKRYVM